MGVTQRTFGKENNEAKPLSAKVIQVNLNNMRNREDIHV
jgi:hypothetical protein